MAAQDFGDTLSKNFRLKSFLFLVSRRNGLHIVIWYFFPPNKKRGYEGRHYKVNIMTNFRLQNEDFFELHPKILQSSTQSSD